MANNPDPVTLMIANTIKPGKLEEYRIWVKGISDAARNLVRATGHSSAKTT